MGRGRATRRGALAGSTSFDGSAVLLVPPVVQTAHATYLTPHDPDENRDRRVGCSSRQQQSVQQLPDMAGRLSFSKVKRSILYIPFVCVGCVCVCTALRLLR